MFTKSFDKYVCDGDRITCEVDGFTVTAKIEHDESHGEPWKEEDGHGPVSDWTNRSKRAGERVLNRDGGSYRYYDFAEAVKIAKRDGWGVNGMEGTRGQIAAAAAEKDFEYLKAWCDDEWHYVGVVLSVERADVELTDHGASLWGIECNVPGSDNSYLKDVANELLDEALDVARATLAKLISA